jgi:ligand-binding sensor domain-containing protein
MRKIIVLLFVFASFINFANAQWQLTSLNSNDVNAIAINGNKIFAGTFGDGMFLSTNNGDNWTTVNTGLTSNSTVNALAISGINIFAGTYTGVFLSSNNGQLWTPVNNGLPANTNVLSLAAKGDTILAGTIYDGVFLSPNNGQFWSAINTGLGSTDVQALIINGNNIFAGTPYGVYLSTNNGNGWIAVNNGLPANADVLSLTINESNIFAGTDTYGVYLSSDSGNSWTAVNNGLPTNATVLSLTKSGNNIFLGGDAVNSGVYMSSNNGSSWTFTGLIVGNIWSLAASDSSIFAGTEPGGLWMFPLSEIVGNKEIGNNYDFTIIPNPFTNSSILKLSKPLQNATLTIYNILGNEVNRLQNLKGSEIQITRKDLKSGMYFFRLMDKNGFVGNGKLLIE